MSNVSNIPWVVKHGSEVPVLEDLRVRSVSNKKILDIADGETLYIHHEEDRYSGALIKGVLSQNHNRNRVIRRKFVIEPVSLEVASKRDIISGGIADILSQNDLSLYLGLTVVKATIERLSIPYKYRDYSAYNYADMMLLDAIPYEHAYPGIPEEAYIDASSIVRRARRSELEERIAERARELLTASRGRRVYYMKHGGAFLA